MICKQSYAGERGVKRMNMPVKACLGYGKYQK